MKTEIKDFKENGGMSGCSEYTDVISVDAYKKLTTFHMYME